MFNVMLVDDDQAVLECMNKFVNWNEMGFRVAGTALSAVQAINILETEYVDVILTDIVMPRRGGLELIHDALEINPYIKTIILSSHDDFSYAKEAMRLGSYDYLTKPVNFDELKNIFKKLYSILNNEISDKKKQTEFQDALQVQFLNNLVNGFFYSTDQINKKASEIGFEINNGDFCLIRILVEEVTGIDGLNSGEDIINFKLEITNIANEFLKEFGKVHIFNNNAKEIALLFYPANTSVYENILVEFTDTIGQNEKINLCIGIGGVYNSLINASKSFFEAGKALEYRFVKKENCLYYKRISEFLTESISVINANQEKPKGIAIESVIKYIHEHYNENITLQKLSEIAYLHPIYLCKVFKEKTGENFMDYLMKIRIEKSMKLLGDLSLRIYDICEMVGYDSPQHFSKVFKDMIGVTPKDYRKKLHVY